MSSISIAWNSPGIMEFCLCQRPYFEVWWKMWYLMCRKVADAWIEKVFLKSLLRLHIIMEWEARLLFIWSKWIRKANRSILIAEIRFEDNPLASLFDLIWKTLDRDTSSRNHKEFSMWLQFSMGNCKRTILPLKLLQTHRISSNTFLYRFSEITRHWNRIRAVLPTWFAML